MAAAVAELLRRERRAWQLLVLDRVDRKSAWPRGALGAGAGRLRRRGAGAADRRPALHRLRRRRLRGLPGRAQPQLPQPARPAPAQAREGARAELPDDRRSRAARAPTSTPSSACTTNAGTTAAAPPRAPARCGTSSAASPPPRSSAAGCGSGSPKPTAPPGRPGTAGGSATATAIRSPGSARSTRRFALGTVLLAHTIEQAAAEGARDLRPDVGRRGLQAALRDRPSRDRQLGPRPPAPPGQGRRRESPSPWSAWRGAFVTAERAAGWRFSPTAAAASSPRWSIRCSPTGVARRLAAGRPQPGRGGRSAAAACRPGCELLQTGRNLGYAGGMNVGIAALLGRGAERLLLLTHDARLRPGALAALREAALSRPEFGVLGAGPRPHRHRAAVLLRRPHRPRRRSTPTAKTRPPASAGGVAACDWVDGGTMLVGREVFERVGAFDERFWGYCEDADLCLRARRAGFGVGVVARRPGRPGPRGRPSASAPGPT